MSQGTRESLWREIFAGIKTHKGFKGFTSRVNTTATSSTKSPKREREEEREDRRKKEVMLEANVRQTEKNAVS